MSKIPKDLDQFKEMVTQVYDNYDPDTFVNKSMKTYLIESNLSDPPRMDKYTEWKSIGGSWSVCESIYDSGDDTNFFVLNKGNGRIWSIFTFSSVSISDAVIEKWVRNQGLDRCWFSGDYLHEYGHKNNWDECGIGLKYENTLLPDDRGMRFSMKAWHGTDMDDEIKNFFDKAKERFTTTSVRWKLKKDGNQSMSSEWYNNGKITIQYSDSITELLESISGLTESYSRSLLEAESFRNQNRNSFEFTFKEKLKSFDEYTDVLLSGKSNLKLWMIETHRFNDFRSYSGIDLHTGDRILLDIGEDYAYMTIPGKGCVNATPRFLAVNGENALGNVKAYYEGCEIFDGSNI